MFAADRVLPSDDAEYAADIWDPWEGMNRSIFRFNAQFDKYVFLPAVRGYQIITPEFLQNRVSDFFGNIKDLTTFINLVLQLKMDRAMNTFGRLGWNTTLGMVGLFDVASTLELNKDNEDFGQTLGHYGAGPGPFLVLPIMGPSNVRDTTGLVVDAIPMWLWDPFVLDGNPQRQIAYYGLRALDERANVAFRYYQTGSPFEYELVRMLWNTKREIEIAR
jgi:phospholipid-binding lipoprotein MlaA